ncbi:MAG: cysteine--tRNA ligase [bacterium]
MLKIYNTLSKKKEVFKPLENKKVNLFVCGPTVYDFSHLGHARTYLVFDMIVKFLKEKGYNVFYLQNITDIDDKIILKAKDLSAQAGKNISPEKLAREFEKEYLKDIKALKIDSVSKYARATDHIKEIISQVEQLLKKGFAYQIEDGIYYDISKFKNYGKLSKRTVLQAEDAVSRIDEGKNKKNKGDFVLWKFSQPKDLLKSEANKQEEPAWQSPWRQGRPGWHIEDTAITEKYFGSQYDVHGGARDLIFPHHEAEISQMEAISGKSPLVKYWIHSGFLTVNGQKMSKSLGNFITIKDFLKENPARLLRFLILKNHYRSPLDYDEKLIKQTKKELEKIDEFTEKLTAKSSDRSDLMSKDILKKYEEEFKKAMEDDFNTPKAVAAIFSLISQGNGLLSKAGLSLKEAKDILSFLKEIDKIFGFIFGKEAKQKQEIPQPVLNLVRHREDYRKQGKWKEADQLRQEIKKMGFQVEDTAKGPKIKKISNS